MDVGQELRSGRRAQQGIEHWLKVLPLRMLQVQYEQLVGDLEGQSRRIIGFLDLPWDDRCLSFHQTKRPCATASVMQVRRPVYNSSVGRWRKYEKHLGPLKTFADCKMHSSAS